MKGIEKIKIPVRPEELTISSIEPYLDSVYGKFIDNAQKISHDYKIYCLNHSILGKTRSHDDTDINNIVVIPDLRAIVDWKTGYVFGNPIKYAQNKTSETDDINYLNKYVRDVCQRTVDKQVGTWAYATGVGYYFIEPKSEDYDIETEAPYVLYCIDSDTCTKVYSSFNGNKQLFDMLYTTYEEIDENKARNNVEVLDIYLPDYLYTYEKRVYGKWTLKNAQPRGTYRFLPLVEKRPNSDGIGIIAMGESMQDAVDNIISNGLDNIEDMVNSIFAYYNVNLGETPAEQKKNHTQMKKNGAVVLNAPQGVEAKLDVISPKSSLNEVNDIYSIINERFHSTLGVPMEVSGTNSGGTTKSGSEVANGYDNAYNRALDDINTFITADTELLKKIMWICKEAPGSKIDNISASDIEIKYSLNLTDNMLTKSQSYGTFIQTMPPAMALRMCRLSNDPEAEGRLIEEYAERQNKVAQETIVVDKVNVPNQTDNGSQE